MGFSNNGEYYDVLEDGYVAGSISVSTTAVEAKVGASRLSKREGLRIYNNSSKVIYFGPSGVTSSTGEPLKKDEWADLPFGEGVAVFVVTDSGTASDVRIQEYA